MKELEAFEALIDDVLFMDVFENICSYDCMKICVHKVKYEVDVAIVFCPDYVLEADNVLMPSKFL